MSKAKSSLHRLVTYPIIVIISGWVFVSSLVVPLQAGWVFLPLLCGLIFLVSTSLIYYLFESFWDSLDNKIRHHEEEREDKLRREEKMEDVPSPEKEKTYATCNLQ